MQYQRLAGLLLVLACCFYPVAMLADLTKLVFYPLVVFIIALEFLGDLVRRAPVNQDLNKSRAFYIFCFSLLLTVFWSEDRWRTLDRGAQLLAFAGVFFVANSLFSAGYRRWLERLSLFLPLSVLLCYLYIYRQHGSVRVSSAEMLDEVGAFSNTGVAMVILCLPFCVYQLRRKDGDLFGKLLAISSLTVMGVVFVMSESRAAIILPLAVLLGSFFALSGNRKAFLKNLGMLALACMLAVSIAVFLGLGDALMKSRAIDRLVSSQIYEGSFLEQPLTKQVDYQRVVMFQTALYVIGSHWLGGIGYGVFGNYMELATGRYTVAHNLIITAWGEGGLLAMTALFYLVVTIFRRTIMALKVLSNEGKKMPLENERFFYRIALLTVAIALLHSLLRPQFNNPMFFISLAIPLSIPPRPALSLCCRG